MNEAIKVILAIVLIPGVWMLFLRFWNAAQPSTMAINELAIVLSVGLSAFSAAMVKATLSFAEFEDAMNRVGEAIGQSDLASIIRDTPSKEER